MHFKLDATHDFKLDATHDAICPFSTRFCLLVFDEFWFSVILFWQVLYYKTVRCFMKFSDWQSPSDSVHGFALGLLRHVTSWSGSRKHSNAAARQIFKPSRSLRLPPMIPHYIVIITLLLAIMHALEAWRFPMVCGYLSIQYQILLLGSFR